MIWRVKSFGSLSLMSSSYFAFIDDADNPNMQPPTTLEVVQTGEAAPAEAGMTRAEDYLVLTVQIKGANKKASYDALVMAFDALKSTSQQLTCLDNDRAEWYVMGRISNHSMKAYVSKITLQVADSVWRSTTQKSDTWSITASGQTRDIVVGGTVEALSIFEVTPTIAKGSNGFAYRKWVRTYNPNAAAVLNELVDVTNGGLDTATLVTAGKMQADGDDARVYDKGKEVDRFLTGMNTASTKIFAGPFNFMAKIEMTLATVIASSGAITSIYMQNTAANKKLLNRLPNARGIIEIDSERFIYSGRDVPTLRIDIAERAVRASSMASHAAGATVKHIQHDVWLYYGNSALTALEVDALHQAAYDIATSTNANRVYGTTFGDVASVRPGAWKAALLATLGKKSFIYYANHGDTTADPATSMGMALKAYTKNGLPKAETGTIEWKLSHPGGITSVINTGEKRRVSNAKWPDMAGLQKSKDGANWVDQFDEASPTAGAYTAITNTALQTLGAGYKHVRYILDGSTAATLNAEADLEIDTVTVVITNPITAALQAEENDYHLDCEIKNVNTGQSLFLTWTMKLTEKLTVDGETRRLTYKDGTNAYRAKRLDAPRLEFLPLQPGVTNQLQFIDVGTSGVTLVTKWTERRKR